ncbi:MAG TPA: HNH endonuclease signature motif containing protein [Acidimicrobiales bacterium]|nr:HNH endonuclease signature motif containing protein [Acidimicrobiales bacterium]
MGDGGWILQLAQGTALTPGSLVPWIEHIDLERAVFEPGGRVEVGITARFFTGGTRRAIEIRDRECTHPFCDVDVEHCQADHIQPYSAGGLTVQENGRLLCGYHNRLRNQRPPPD